MDDCFDSFFFFKQKTAYEMRISDWSSDVCSSDLAIEAGAATVTLRTRAEHAVRIGDEVHALALRLDVVDDGHGVPEALAEQVFLPLVSGRAEGSGLGLALAQQVAREHRGSLAYRSRPGHTVFTMLLPGVQDRKSTRLNSSH